MNVAERDWETTETGIVYPGPTFGVPGPILPSAGGARVQAFLEKHCRQSKGRWRGKPLTTRPFQRGLVHELFRTRDGRRIYHEALVGLPRKNGKSTIAAGLALYLLLLDGEPSPEVYSAAGDRAQARLVFSEAAKMVRASPRLSEWCRVLKNEIVVDHLDGVYRAISADAGLAHGSNPSGYVFDEVHVQKDGELYYALNTGMDARENPLGIAITTAGYDPDSIEADLFKRGLAGDDDRMLMAWWGAPDGADITDPAVWRAANPAPWITIDRLERAYKRLPASVFARLHLNQHTESDQSWLPTGAWRACGVGGLFDWTGERVWIGVDIGLRHDRSAIVEVMRIDQPGEPPRYRCRAYVFEPAERDGVVDFGPIKAKLAELMHARRVASIAYDPTYFHESASELSETFPMVEWPQGNVKMVPASMTLRTVIIERRVEHELDFENDAILAKHVNAAAVRETERGWRISKSKSKYHIDACVALSMAVSEASETELAGVGARVYGS